MDNAHNILESFKNSRISEEITPFVEAFKQLAFDERKSVETELIEILKDKDVSQTVRGWIPDLMASIGTTSVHKALMDQLVSENQAFVRLWIGLSLLKYFSSDESISLLVSHYDNEPRTINRYEFAQALAEEGHPLAQSKLEKLLNDKDPEIRLRVAKGLEKAQVRELANPLMQRLEIENSPEISKIIVKALMAINHREAKPVLLKRLQFQEEDQELTIILLQAIGQLATADDQDVIDNLLLFTCYENRVIALMAADMLLTLVEDNAAELLVNFGLQQTNSTSLSCVADALRLIGGTDAINYLKRIKGDSEHVLRAQTLLEMIGGRQAVDFLINQRLETLNQAGIRVKEFDNQALTLFTETIQEAKQGFKVSLGMSITIFGIGIILLIISIYLILQGENLEKFLGAGSGLIGLGTILAMFYKGPLERIEQSVSNLVQTEIAFLGYIRQVTQITAMFEREYLSNEEFGIDQLEKMLSYTERTIKTTMPLVNQYTAISLPKANQQI